MSRRESPDILTPREQEVLALLREELSNEQIAERLGISVSGVKYHVSEILGKLGLENRTDAARWAAAAPSARRPWWAAAIAPLGRVRAGWLSGTIAGGVAFAIVAGIGLLIWALASTGGDSSGSVEPTPANLDGLTVENFAPRVRAAMGAEGTVFHVVSERLGERGGTTARNWTVEAWVDVGREMTRETFTQDPAGGGDLPAHLVSVAIDDTEYSTDGTESTSGPVQSCYGVTLFIAIALPPLCDTSIDEAGLANATLDIAGQYEGAPAVSLTIESDIVSSDPQGNEIRTPSRTTFYADRETLLPLARVMEVQALGVATRVIDTYASELIAPDSLPDDFFDPASIGYVAATPTPVIDPLEALQGAREAGVTPYWLGEDLVDGDLGSALHFRTSALGAPVNEGPGYRVSVEYEVVSAFREGDVSIWLWTPDAWQTYYDEAVTAMAFLGPCGSQEEIDVAGGTATVLAAHEPQRKGPPAATPSLSGGTIAPDVTPTPSSGCPEGPFDLYAAIVDYGDTIVTINVPHCILCLGRAYDRDPWDSRTGMLAIIAGLTVRE